MPRTAWLGRTSSVACCPLCWWQLPLGDIPEGLELHVYTASPHRAWVDCESRKNVLPLKENTRAGGSKFLSESVLLPADALGRRQSAADLRMVSASRALDQGSPRSPPPPGPCPQPSSLSEGSVTCPRSTWSRGVGSGMLLFPKVLCSPAHPRPRDLGPWIFVTNSECVGTM